MRRAFFFWVGLGLVAGVLLSGAFVAYGASARMQSARKGWNLRPVLLVTRDFAAGTPLLDGDLADSQLPEQFVSDSTLTPLERRFTVGQPPTVALKRGDALVWGDFATGLDRRRVKACVDAIRAPATAAAALAGAHSLEVFRRQATPLPPPSPLPSLPAPGPDGKVLVIAAASDLEPTLLTRSQLTVLAVEPRFVTASQIPASALEALLGARLVVAVAAGDPLSWQFLDDPDVGRNPASCARLVTSARTEAGDRAAAEQATAFARREGAAR